MVVAVEWIDVSIQCIDCGSVHTFKVRKDKLEEYRQGKGYVQKLFPHLTPGEREMFISRICEDCFDKIFPDE